MTAKSELIRKLAEGKGAMVGYQFARFIQGLITREEFDDLANNVEAQFEKESRELRSVSEEAIQAVTMYLER